MTFGTPIVADPNPDDSTKDSWPIDYLKVDEAGTPYEVVYNAVPLIWFN